jgi:hypothetical protein
MSEELEVIREVAQRLDEARLAYVISGSIAANYYTEPRMTRDIDIVVEMRPADVERFSRLFKDKFFVDEEAIAREVQNRGMFNLIHNQYVVKIDFILRKDSGWQEAMFKRRREVMLGRVPVWLITPEDLIIAKLSWAKDSQSELQLKDVRNLLRSVGSLDQYYVNEWVSSLGLENVYQKVR